MSGHGSFLTARPADTVVRGTRGGASASARSSGTPPARLGLPYPIFCTRIDGSLTSLPPLDLAAVPAAATRAVIEATAPVVVWVAEGAADAETSGTRARLASGDALWVPAGERVVVRGAERSCVVPVRIRPEDRASGPSAPFTVSLDPASQAALLGLFTRSLGVLHGGGVRAAHVLGILGHHGAAVSAPAMPRSPDLRRVAARLLDDPAAAHGAVGSAHGLGPTVLARRFRAETGWTPARWRTRHVLARAAERIVHERRVSAGAAITPYASPQAFARAFRREWGFSPATLLSNDAPCAAVSAVSDVLGPQRNGYHIVFWVASGRATATIDDRRIRLETGDIFRLPAGRTAGYRSTPGAAVVPLGWMPGGAALPSDVVARAGANARATLLRLAAWAYADVVPAAVGSARRALEEMLGGTPLAAHRPEVTAATYELLDDLYTHPGNAEPLTELAARVGLSPAELSEAIAALTGTTLSTWRARTRMTWARRLLREGIPPTQIARRLGYADAASFSRAFSRAHGCSPTRFRARGTRPPVTPPTRA